MTSDEAFRTADATDMDQLGIAKKLVRLEEQIKALQGGNTNDLEKEFFQERIKRIYEGTPGEKAGKKWVELEMSGPRYTGGIPVEGIEGKFYHEMINEPPHGSVVVCFWDSNTKAWLPDYPWPEIVPQADIPDDEE